MVFGKPVHIRAEPGSIAERVVVVGDPARARLVAEMLEGARVVNEHRGFTVYTGSWRGVEVSVAVHGVGGPSAAIVFEELYMYGARAMVRLGSCGGLRREVGIGDVVVAAGALYYPGGAGLSGYTGGPGRCAAASANPLLVSRLYEALRGVGGLRVHLGPVVSSDSFYAEDPAFVESWSRLGAVAVEMEVAALYALSWMRGFDAAAVLIVSDNLVAAPEVYLTTEELAEATRKAAEKVLDVLAEWRPGWWRSGGG